MQRWIGCWATVGALVLGTGGAWAQGGDTKGEAAAATDTKSDDSKAGDAKAGDAKAGDEKPADAKAGEAKPEDAKTEQPKTGDAAPAAATTPAVDGATYQVRLRELEQRVDELKEQIRRSHTRLSLLSETILSGGVGGARAEIVFTNDMSNIFKLNRALFVLDGAVQYNKQDDTGALADQKKIPIFSGSVPPG
ncbi:MAG TPA: hypothetical protein PKD61_13170, partial [Polyangiaceae bacterium]|nr:hypothetical protein [Polyangiaceae bacterium]